MRVFKFGGASVKDADGVRNLTQIIRDNAIQNPLIVVSAMGKTTNALEEVARAFYANDGLAFDKLESLKTFHIQIMNDLFESNHLVFNKVTNFFVEIEWALEDEPRPDFGYEYDQIVSIGELISTTIISAYLSEVGIENSWLDARDMLKTDNNYRSANIDWELSARMVAANVPKNKIVITQGFIGCTSENFTTTLGREGSDYSAAIFASLLGANQLVVWKDVPGVLNADPRYFDNPEKINSLSYQEAIELTYYGASVIHPKTIQALKRNSTSLEVRSFLNPVVPGTLIAENLDIVPQTAFLILKKNQKLISLSVSDLGFVVENHLSRIFSILFKHHAKVNLVQNSAVSCSFALEVDDIYMPDLLNELSKEFKLRYNNNLELITIRHYQKLNVDALLKDKEVLLSQKNRTTLQVLYR